ncbi:MAG: PilZ domain-containing protein [Terriglobia bacterium]
MAADPIRRATRIDITEEVYFEGDHVLKAARWTDISLGGIFIQTKTPLSIGSSVKMGIRMPGEAKSYQASGIVRHSLRWVGMGLEFTHLPFALKDRLQQILTEENSEQG